MQNNGTKLAVFAFVLGVVFLFVLKSRNSPVAESMSTETPLPSAKTDRLQALIRLPRAAPKIAETVALPKVDPISPACRMQWKSLNDLNLQRYLENSESLPAELSAANQCTGLPKSFTAPTDILKNACKPVGSAEPLNKREAAHQQCYQALVIYRAMIADFDSQNLTAAQISDPRLLSDKVIASLFKELTDGLPFAERLLEIEPNFTPAAKMAAVLQLVSADTKKGVGTFDTAKSALERAERLDNSDPAFYKDLRSSIEMAAAESVTKQVEVAKKQAEAQPGTPHAAFLSSFVAFKEGRMEEASRYLADALKADPNNIDYQQTQNEMRELIKQGIKNPSEQKIFSHSYPLDITKLIP